MSIVDSYLNKLGQGVAEWGGMASLLAGKDLRVGGGSGLGAKIAGNTTPFFSVTPVKAGELIGSQYDPYKGAQSTQGYANPVNQTGGGVPSGSTNGQVLGIKDNGGVDTSSASNEAMRREAQVRGEIEGGYGSYINNLSGLQSSFDTAQQDELSSAAKTYEQIFGGLQDQQTANMNKLESNKTEVNNRTASSIKDLQSNLANVLRGSSMQYGAMGAGDTSATRVMLPYAYTKLAGAQEGGIRTQANQQLFDIDQQAADTQTQYAQLVRQTEIDKESSLGDIKKYYGDAIRNVQMAIAQAPLDKAKDLASLSQSLLSEAQSNLRQLEAENRQRQENIKTWATNRMSELNDYKLKLAGTANFSPQDVVWNELQMQGVTPINSMNYGDYVTSTRKKYLGEA